MVIILFLRGKSWIFLNCIYMHNCILLLKIVLILKDHNAVTQVRLKPAVPRSRVKHSTTELLRSRRPRSDTAFCNISCWTTPFLNALSHRLLVKSSLVLKQFTMRDGYELSNPSSIWVFQQCCWFWSAKDLGIWAATWDFKQCGMCDQQRLRPACAYAQADQSLC